MSVTPAQLAFVKDSLALLVENLYREGQISRAHFLRLRQHLVNNRATVRSLATELYGARREVVIPQDGAPPVCLQLLSLRELTGRPFDLLAFRGETATRPKPLRCFVGHRFTAPIEAHLRWNLRELFQLVSVQAEYAGFDGAAVNLLPELVAAIGRADFCLFDNRDTTSALKPNVYIEAGIALALKKPFIFCHYRREVWPADFAGVLYLPYRNYADLCQHLYRKLPLFLKKHTEC